MNRKFLVIISIGAVLVLGIAIYTAKNPSNLPLGSQEQQEAAKQPGGKQEPTSASTNTDNKVVATYNGVELRKSEVNERLRTMFGAMSGDNKQADYDQLPENVRENLLRGIVVGKLLSAEAAKTNIANDPAITKQLSDIKEQLIQKEFITQKIKADITEDKIKQRYNEMIKEEGNKEEVKARHILVETEKEAQEIAEELKKGASFEELAKKKSKDANKSQGGDLGYFGRGQMVKPFEDTVFSLKKGEVSAPVKTDFGWHIIKLEDKRQAPIPTFEEARPRLEGELGQKVVQQYIEKLLADAKFQQNK